MNIDVFRGDGFSLTSLTDAINRLPFVPTRIGSLGYFRESGISTLSAEVEVRNGKLTLVQSRPRNSPGAYKTNERRKLHQFQAIHLPQQVEVMADEVQGLRAFGSETEAQTAQGLLDEKNAVALTDLALTLEYQRVGAIKGLVVDADGTTTLYDYFTTLGVTQQVVDFNLEVATQEQILNCLAVARAIEDELGGLVYTGIRAFCGKTFFNDFTTHATVKDAYRLYQESVKLRSDNRGGFEFGNIVFEEYRGSVNGTPFIADTEAYFVPEGVPGMFMTKYAPANYVETVNTLGVRTYQRIEFMKYNKGIEAEIQSNPIHLNMMPRAVIKGVRT